MKTRMELNGLEKIDLLAHGAASERFAMELDTVIRNILDPNTKPTAKRAITLKITFMPDAARQVTAMSIETKSTVAPAEPVSSTMMLGIEPDGTVMATELGRMHQVPGQIDVDGETFEPAKAGLTVLG